MHKRTSVLFIPTGSLKLNYSLLQAELLLVQSGIDMSAHYNEDKLAASYILCRRNDISTQSTLIVKYSIGFDGLHKT